MVGCKIADFKLLVRVQLFVKKSLEYRAVAKSVRHRTLTPVCVGSNPAGPAYRGVVLMVAYRSPKPQVRVRIPTLLFSTKVN